MDTLETKPAAPAKPAATAPTDPTYEPAVRYLATHRHAAGRWSAFSAITERFRFLCVNHEQEEELHRLLGIVETDALLAEIGDELLAAMRSAQPRKRLVRVGAYSLMDIGDELILTCPEGVKLE